MEVEFLDKNIIDEVSIQQISEEIGQLVEESTLPRILINFHEVDHLSSAALGSLITINNRVASKHGQLRLVEIRGQILEVFRITKLDRLFEIHETKSDALNAFS